VPYERSDCVRGAVTRAFVLHATELWKSHDDSQDWTNWYANFLSSWKIDELKLVWDRKTFRELIRGLDIDSLPSESIARVCATLATIYSKFGELLSSRNCNGQSPLLDLRKPVRRGHIAKAAERAKLSRSEIDDALASLSDYLGWEITVIEDE
jgi:hypothetical protein